MKWPWVSRTQYDALHDAFTAETERSAGLRASVEHMERALANADGRARAYQDHAERADARFDALWQKYLEATRPPEPKAVVAQTYRSDEQAVRVVEDGFVKKLAADLKAKGIPDAVAQMEATRIRRETTRVGA